MKTKFLLSFFLLLVVFTSYSQTRVRGKVTDGTTGIGLPGATILQKGTLNGATSDSEGNYDITLTESDAVLVFSFVGFITLEFQYDGAEELNVTMQEEALKMGEVIVIGYGTQTKADLTGSVSTLEGSDIVERKTTQLSAALQGAIPGVTVTRASGAPGATGTIRIRGITSLGNNNPLVLIDGAPGSIDDVNPDDVENISVLKDAASAAIYGSRAAAGVVLITTKRAKAGAAAFSYNFDGGFQILRKQPEFADAQTYMRLNNQMLLNDGRTPIWDDDFVNDYLTNNAQNPDEFPNTDWIGSFFENSAYQQRHNLSMSVGDGNLKSRASLGWIEQDALTPNRNYKRFNLRVNNNYAFSDKLTAIFDFSYKRTAIRRPARGTDIFQIYRLAPIWDDFFSDGRFAPARTGNNPVANALNGGNVDERFNSLFARLGLTFEPIENLTISTIVSPEVNFNRTTNFSKVVEFTALDDPGEVEFTSGTNDVLAEAAGNTQRLNIQITSQYDFEVGDDHKFSVLGGFEDNRFETEGLGLSRTGFVFTDFSVINAGSEEIQTTSGNKSQTALRSFFGRVNYNFSNKYRVQFNARYDGSSRFAEDHRWGFFPSIAAAWTVSNESWASSFLKNNSLKVKASWGRLGNQNIGTYPYISEVTLGNNLFYDGNTILPLTTADIRTLNVPDITWETTESYNLGVDFSLLKQRLAVSLEGFRKNTFDLLRSIPIPDVIGRNPGPQNVAELETEGWEAAIGWTDKIGDFSYYFNANLTDNKTIVTDLEGTSTLGNTALIEGEEINVYYGYRSLGFFQSQEEIDNAALLNGREQPGDMRYEDINGDGVITADGDRVPLGSSRNRYVYGGNFGFKYKGVDFHTAFQGVARRTRYYSSFITEPFINSTGNVPVALIGNTWTEDNPNAAYPRLTDANSGMNYRLSDYWLGTATYFRVANVTVGYTFPEGIVDRMGMNSLRVYLTATDPILLTKYPDGFDPETSTTASPITTTILLGVNVKF